MEDTNENFYSSTNGIYERPMAYVFTQPTFNTVEECKSYAIDNSESLLIKLYNEFGPNYRPHMVSCVDKDTVEKIKQQDPSIGKELET